MSRLALTVWFFCYGTAQDISFTEDIKALSELPLEKLLHIKRTFDVDRDIISEQNINSTVPQALALQSKTGSKDGEVYHYDDSSSKDKSSTIQSIFQISITTLAFLAFGGYLICLLVQAIKGKNSDTQTTATQIMSALINSSASKIRRRRPTRAPYSQQPPVNSYSYRRRKPRPKREIFTDQDGDSMYFSLVNLAEGYTKYHTEDYLKYNFSSSYF